jgi:anti-sigma factor RsiW
MNCHDARQRFPDLLDGLLSSPERRDIERHLETCAECAREHRGLRQTVALLQRVGPARAPAGFADRVIARAAPEPRLRRALRAAFVPLGMKLPAQAAAMALLTIGTAYVFQRTPALRQAARTEVPGGWRDAAGTPPASRPTAPGSTAADAAGTDRGPSASEAPSAAPASPEVLDGGGVASGRPSGALLETPGPRPATPERLTAPPIAPPLSEPRPGRADEPRAGPAVAPAPPAAAPASAAPATTAESRAPVGEQAAPETGGPGSRARDSSMHAPPAAEVRERADAPPPPAFPPTAQEQRLARRGASMLAPSDVTIRLVTSDRAALSAALADLVTRAGGAEAGRRPDGSDLVIEVVVPRPAYAEFARGVARLGQTADVPEAPELPPSVRVLIRIAP